MEAWQQFMKTGKIEDYLIYANIKNNEITKK
jgi:hypothetical protein